MVNVAKNGLLESRQPNIKYNQKDCSFCILDETDACSRGAGRAIDDTICDDFLEDMSIAEFAIMELEQVREEIEKELTEYENYPSQDGMVFTVIHACKRHIEIIDKRIAEIGRELE